MIILQLGGGSIPRFLPLVRRTEAGVWVAQVALAIIVARNFTTTDSGHCRQREAAKA